MARFINHAACGALLVAIALAPLGCDSSGVGRTYPVSGNITLNGKPFTATTTSVVFKPDTAKGNATEFEPVGAVDENGQYQVKTKGKEGAPPGWYKVVVSAYDGQPAHPRKANDKRPVASSLLPAKYGSAATTKLAVEVVENPAPAAYDLQLTDR